MGLKKPVRVRRLVVGFLLVMVGVPILQVLVLKLITPPMTVPMAWEWVRNIPKGKADEFPIYQWRDLNEISPNLRRAVLAAEDQRFLLHHGFDFIEIRKVTRDLIAGNRVRGASTITMQAARSLFLIPSRSVIRKGVEIYYAFLMECFWDKPRILEIYLNTVDWGHITVGAEAAANRYFSSSAAHLTPSQAALMASILPSPHSWSVKKPTSYLRARQRRILKDMKLMPLL